MAGRSCEEAAYEYLRSAPFFHGFILMPDGGRGVNADGAGGRVAGLGVCSGRKYFMGQRQGNQPTKSQPHQRLVLAGLPTQRYSFRCSRCPHVSGRRAGGDMWSAAVTPSSLFPLVRREPRQHVDPSFWGKNITIITC